MPVTGRINLLYAGNSRYELPGEGMISWLWKGNSYYRKGIHFTDRKFQGNTCYRKEIPGQKGHSIEK